MGAGQRGARQPHLTIFGWFLEGVQMLEQDAGREAHRTFAVDTGISEIDDPKQGARLVRAFLRISDPTVRLEIVEMIENVGSALADYDHPCCKS
jgi:hypothetical protein